jgi:hypothetical protein
MTRAKSQLKQRFPAWLRKTYASQLYALFEPLFHKS